MGEKSAFEKNSRIIPSFRIASIFGYRTRKWSKGFSDVLTLTLFYIENFDKRMFLIDGNRRERFGEAVLA